MRRGGKLRAAAPFDSAPLQNAKPKMMTMETISIFVMPARIGKKVAAVFGDDDGDGGSGAAGGEPVAPADDKTGVIAEGAARKIILAAAAGNGGAEFGHGGCAGECVESTENPNSEKHPGVGEKLGDVAGRSNDAGGDGVADRRSHAEPHAENLKQAAAADGGSGERLWERRRKIRAM